MGTIVTIRPNGVISGGAQWNNVGGAANIWTALSDSSNATYTTSQSLKSQYKVTMGTTTIAPKTVKRWRIGMVCTMSGASALIKVQADFGNGGFWVASFSGPSTANQTRYSNWIDSSPSQAQIDAATMWLEDRSGSAGNQQIKEIFVELELEATPVTTVTSPAEGGTVSAGRPSVVWDFAQADGEPQYSAQVAIVPSAIYSVGGFDINAEFADFGAFQEELAANGGLATWPITGDNSVVWDPDQWPLLPIGTYRAYVRTGIVAGGTTLFSAIDSNTFTIAYNVPAAPAIASSAATQNGPGIVVSGPAFGANISTTSAVLRLQRSEDNGVTWKDMTNGYQDGIAFGSAWSNTYRDREATHGVSTKYRAQIQTKDTLNNVWVSSAWSAVLTNTLSFTDTTTQGWQVWKWVRTVAGWIAGDEDGFYYEKGTFTVEDVMVADEPHDYSQAPGEELSVVPLGRTKAVVVAGALAGDEGDLSFVCDISRDTAGNLIEGTFTEAELLDMLTAQFILVRKPGMRTRWIAWTGERAWRYEEGFKAVTCGFVETDPPVRSEG